MWYGLPCWRKNRRQRQCKEISRSLMINEGRHPGWRRWIYPQMVFPESLIPKSKPFYFGTTVAERNESIGREEWGDEERRIEQQNYNRYDTCGCETYPYTAPSRSILTSSRRSALTIWKTANQWTLGTVKINKIEIWTGISCGQSENVIVSIPTEKSQPLDWNLTWSASTKTILSTLSGKRTSKKRIL